LLKNFGAGLFIEPHGITTDGAGNVWVGDEAARDGKGVQVTKLDPTGKVLMTLGKAFIQPTAVVIAPSGDIFASDGHEANYDNARVLKFSKDGTFIKAFGGKGSGVGELRATHGLTMDSAGRIFVADRGNGRIAIFDQDGKFLAEWRQFGRPSGIFIDRNDVIYVTDTQSSDDKAAGPPPGYRYNPGCKQGIRVGSAKDGKVTALIPPPDPKRRPPEGVAADAQGNIYAATTTQRTVFRYRRSR
jgi:sugar lactone lactonase YvrE